jgi:hypothetical protein
MMGKGPIDNSPLNTHVVVTTPKSSPATVCQRFHPRYGTLVGVPAYRYRLRGEYIQTAMTRPITAETVPINDDQTTSEYHSAAWRRMGVK